MNKDDYIESAKKKFEEMRKNIDEAEETFNNRFIFDDCAAGEVANKADIIADLCEGVDSDMQGIEDLYEAIES